MKKLTKKNLKLSRETLLALEAGHLELVQGGSIVLTNCVVCNAATGGRNTCLC